MVRHVTMAKIIKIIRQMIFLVTYRMSRRIILTKITGFKENGKIKVCDG